jgi:phosphoribosylanthranilate isomerase
MTRVKICGITCAEDAAAAVAAGAHALGFVFVPDTPRFVPPERAAAIIAGLPPFVATVGVFVNRPVREVVETAARCGLQLIQLHGEENEAFARQLPLPVVRAIRVQDATSLAILDTYPARAFLLDAFVPGIAGGTGQTFPWELAATRTATARIILSGGLTPDTVESAIRRVHPYGVDASSGVERCPGRKDPWKLKEFIDHVRRADLD